MLVVDNKLRILESIVDADEVFKIPRPQLAEMKFRDDVENLSGSIVIPRVVALSQPSTGAIKFPVNSLYKVEQTAHNPEADDRQRSLEQQHPPECHIDAFLCSHHLIG